jgi:hypothetical protein
MVKSETVNLGPLLILPPGEQTGQSHGLAILALDPGGNGLARAPVRLKDGLGRHDAVACPFPRITKTRLGGRRLAASIEGVAPQLQIGRPMWDQAKAAGQGLTLWHRLISRISVRRYPDERRPSNSWGCAVQQARLPMPPEAPALLWCRCVETTGQTSDATPRSRPGYGPEATDAPHAASSAFAAALQIAWQSPG